MLVITVILSAQAIAGAVPAIEFTLSPQVQDLLNKSSPDQRAKLNLALRTSNNFARQILNGNAMDEMRPDWDKDIGKITGVDFLTFKDIMAKKLGDDWDYINICNAVEIANIAIANATKHVVITYVATGVGKIMYGKTKVHYEFAEFHAEPKGRKIRFDISVKAHNRIANFNFEKQLLPHIYTIEKNGLLWHIEMVYSDRKSINNPGYVGPSTPELEGRLASYKKALEMLTKSVSDTCANPPSGTNHPK